MGYKILGFLVWKGVGVIVRRNLPSRRVVAFAFVAGAVIALAAAGAKREASS